MLHKDLAKKEKSCRNSAVLNKTNTLTKTLAYKCTLVVMQVFISKFPAHLGSTLMVEATFNPNAEAYL
jgi:hypothetical protein